VSEPTQSAPQSEPQRWDDPEDLAMEDDWTWADERDGWVPPSIDVNTPSVARMYDYYLGGKDNFEIDRAAGEQALKVVTNGRELARSNRRFLTHATRTMAEAGVDQFIDLGTGIPTSPNVHEVAREIRPKARVAYVDNDPIVMAHGRALLAQTAGVVCVPLDLRRPQEVLGDPHVQRALDLGRPVGVLMIAVLHFIDHDLSCEIVARYRDALAPGSWLAISAGTTEGVDPGVIESVQSIYRNSSAPMVLRSRAQLEQLFEGFDLDGGGGLSDVRDWAAEPLTAPVSISGLCGIARKE
jgi:hypothetical protein